MSYTNALKKSTALDYETIQKRIEEQNSPTKKFEKPPADTRFWKLTRDKAGNGFAQIRFLPPAIVNGEPEDVTWVRYWDYGFQGPTGKWYIERSLQTIDEKDPLAEYNSALWNQEKGEDTKGKKQARNQKRRLHYVSNILVINDPANPENNGKVFLFVYGKKIFDKIQAVMFPKVPGVPKINVFGTKENPGDGANFNLIIETVATYPNYDQSRFDPPSDLADLDTIGPMSHSLKELVTKDKCKPRAELEQRLNEVFGFDVQKFVENSRMTPGYGLDEDDTAAPQKTAASAPVVDDDEDDPDIQRFKNLT